MPVNNSTALRKSDEFIKLYTRAKECFSSLPDSIISHEPNKMSVIDKA